MCKLLETRGYLVDREALMAAPESYKAVRAVRADQDPGRDPCGDQGPCGDDQVLVFFPQGASKVGVIQIRHFVKEMSAAGVSHAIIVGGDELTPPAKQAFDANKDLRFEYFLESELAIDKLSHELVPKHELLSDWEKEQLLTRLRIKESQLPKMTSSDAIARYFGARRGQVFRITRPSESSGTTVYYRFVA